VVAREDAGGPPTLGRQTRATLDAMVPHHHAAVVAARSEAGARGLKRCAPHLQRTPRGKEGWTRKRKRKKGCQGYGNSSTTNNTTNTTNTNHVHHTHEDAASLERLHQQQPSKSATHTTRTYRGLVGGEGGGAVPVPRLIVLPHLDAVVVAAGYQGIVMGVEPHRLHILS
jgi:hypothetical protein